MKKLLLAITLVLTASMVNVSCTEQPLNDETVLTEPGDSTNSGNNNPPPAPDNGEG